MNLERYRVPASAREGVVIELDGTTDAAFRVRLPSHYNRPYSLAAARALAMRMGEDGKPDLTQVDFVAWREARLMAFLEHCIVDLPEGLTREALADEFRPALQALFDRAEEMASDEEAEAIETTKK
jgi:hypothetical protein